jgi:hypothetical protein
MPTVVAKGLTAMRLDTQYATAEGRWESLKLLRAALANWNDGAGVAVGQGRVLDGTESNHLHNDWFSAANNFSVVNPEGTSIKMAGVTIFNSTTAPLEEAKAKDAERLVVAGLIEALEISLGLSQAGTNQPDLPSEAGELDNPYGAGKAKRPNNGPNLLDKPQLQRDVPVEVFWVCGKADNFEVQISWNERQVTVFIVTPPWNVPITGFQGTSNRNMIDKAKVRRSRGMICVSAPKVAKGAPEYHLLSLKEGG